MPDQQFSVIIPVLNESLRIENCIKNIRAVNPNAEIIISDGGSKDSTVEIGQAQNVTVCPSPPGRGTQCNAGARQAKGDILIFQHVDTQLPKAAFAFLRDKFADENVLAGTFRMRFDEKHWFLDICGFCTRYDSIFTRFGDQCIVVRKNFFEKLGGFPDWPLFEDVEFLRRARRKTRIWSFPLEVTTSARRFTKNGIFRQQLFNSFLLVRYLSGCDVQYLAERYRKFGKKS